MKLSLAAFVLSALPLASAQDIIRAQAPMQTFYIPLPEQSMFDNMFTIINEDRAKAPIQSLLSFTISTDNTVIWYDHWEDGFEDDVRNPQSGRTEIWGDGDASNGCSPSVSPCSDSTDVLNAGDNIVIQNTVDLPRSTFDYTGIRYDGGDKVLASYPITVVRGGYPKEPGSLMAGAVEVHDTDQWGYEFEAPAGTDMVMDTNAFEYSSFFVMAKEATTLILPSGETKPLHEGRGIAFSVKQGDKLTSDKPVQVMFITGDKNSAYELRWYSLIPTERWTNDYLSPVGDSVGNTKMLLYNPGSSKIDVEVTYIENNAVLKKPFTVESKKHTFTHVIPTGSGARVTGTGNFVALSLTDAEWTVKTADYTQNTGGQWYDWGCPVVPVNLLTPQVQIGLGYGCTDNKCGNDMDRSCVWLSVLEDAHVFIDYDNTGSDYDVKNLKQYEGIQVRDPNDSDMSGAIIFATKWDGNPNSVPDPDGQPVDIAAAWGQDPAVSKDKQWISLDLGTVVVPFTTLRVTKVANKGKAIPGDRLKYTIRVINVGQTTVEVGKFRIVDPELDSSNYIPRSTLYTTYSSDGNVTAEEVPDDTVGLTPFPLDEEGLRNLYALPRRGGTHEVSFEVFVNPTMVTKSSILNQGFVEEDDRKPQQFKVETPVLFLPSISIQNTVYLGHDNGVSCSNSVESVTGTFQTAVTYCFVVTNTGNTILMANIDNPDLDFGEALNTPLMPGDSFTIAVPKSIAANLTNNAAVTGTSVFPNGDPIPNVDDVVSSDPSHVVRVEPNPSIKIENTVLLGASDAISKACAVGGEEKVTGVEGAPVTYCFKITNTGNTYLGGVTVTDPVLNDFIRERSGDHPLAPNATFTMPVPLTIVESVVNTATVVANPVLIDGTDIPNLDDVTHSDPSEVVKTQPKSGDKPVFNTPDGNVGTFTECMLPHWHDSGAKSGLQCTAKEVYLENIKNDVPATCTEGEMIKVNIYADIHFNSHRYDPAFFVATDGGDAMTGSCLLKGFEKGVDYKVVDQDDPSVIVGHVGWDDDHKGGNDPCGDVFIDGGGGGNVPSSIINADVKCTDRNGDGSMDIAVCFSWRVRGKDGFCTLTPDDPDTQGSLADVFPANPAKCFCFVYEVDDISVDPVGGNDFDVCV